MKMNEWKLSNCRWEVLTFLSCWCGGKFWIFKFLSPKSEGGSGCVHMFEGTKEQSPNLNQSILDRNASSITTTHPLIWFIHSCQPLHLQQENARELSIQTRVMCMFRRNISPSRRTSSQKKARAKMWIIIIASSFASSHPSSVCLLGLLFCLTRHLMKEGHNNQLVKIYRPVDKRVIYYVVLRIYYYSRSTHQQKAECSWWRRECMNQNRNRQRENRGPSHVWIIYDRDVVRMTYLATVYLFL